MRESGILLPISSLPSQHGIGTLGKEAFNFVDFLNNSKQTYWQVLPIGPTGYGDSPYQSFSAFAGNPYLIDLDELVEDGYVDYSQIINSGIRNSSGRIDYNDIYLNKMRILRSCVSNIDENSLEYRNFILENGFWIEDYSLFMTLKEANQMRPFWEWEEKQRFRNEAELKLVRRNLKQIIDFWKKIQFIFNRQWKKLKEYANSKEIKIIGDMPIYVSKDSCELWMNPDMFITDDMGMPTEVAGCPPDDFSPEGQLWGNPIYDWDYHRNENYRWWTKRIENSRKHFDVLRIDHFRGFSGYYSVSVDKINAIEGKWYKGPGKDFINVIKTGFPELPIIAENLGYLTDDVNELLKYSGFKGMKVLQFGFSSDGNNTYLPHNYEKNSVVYTGTHDNQTLKEWAETRTGNELEYIMKYLNVRTAEDISKYAIRAVFQSHADIVITPIQDWLELGYEGRINYPGKSEGNWQWRLTENQLTEDLCNKISNITEIYGRENGKYR